MCSRTISGRARTPASAVEGGTERGGGFVPVPVPASVPGAGQTGGLHVRRVGRRIAHRARRAARIPAACRRTALRRHAARLGEWPVVTAAPDPVRPVPPSDSDLVRAARGLPVSRTPVWFMRQAGRSLPEYRALRAGTAMLAACQDPDLVTEITLQPVRRHGVDAAILFSDIVLPLVVAGVDIEIKPGVGPVVASPLRSVADVDALPLLDPSHLDFLTTAVALAGAGAGPDPADRVRRRARSRSRPT